MTKLEIEAAILGRLQQDIPTWGIYIFPNEGAEMAHNIAIAERQTTLFIHYAGNDRGYPEYTLSWRIYVAAKAYSSEAGRIGAMEAIKRIEASLDNWIYDADAYRIVVGADEFLEEKDGVWYYIVNVSTKRIYGT